MGYIYKSILPLRIRSFFKVELHAMSFFSDKSLNVRGIGLQMKGLGILRGSVSMEEAMSLLEGTSQQSTIWSIVYHIEIGEVHIAIGREFGVSFFPILNKFLISSGR